MVAEPEHDDKRPVSRRVADQLMARIDAGTYPPGSSLPPYRQLAAEYDVAVNTAIAAVRVLRDRGIVTIRRNAGAKVRDRAEEPDLPGELHTAQTELAELRDQVRKVSSGLDTVEARLRALRDALGADEE